MVVGPLQILGDWMVDPYLYLELKYKEIRTNRRIRNTHHRMKEILISQILKFGKLAKGGVTRSCIDANNRL
jgi:hypothetical protein